MNVRRETWLGAIVLMAAACASESGRPTPTDSAQLRVARQLLLSSEECSLDADCGAGVLCSVARCVAGVCVSNPLLDCRAEADDEASASVNVGDDLTSGVSAAGGGGTCTEATSCNDGVACTLDVCLQTASTCSHAWVDGCCQAASDCVTDLPCQIAACVDGVCLVDADASCGGEPAAAPASSIGIACQGPSQCDDDDPCTLDVCAEPIGLCANLQDPSCDGDATAGIDVTIGLGDDDGEGPGAQIDVGLGIGDDAGGNGGSGAGLGVTLGIGDGEGSGGSESAGGSSATAGEGSGGARGGAASNAGGEDSATAGREGGGAAATGDSEGAGGSAGEPGAEAAGNGTAGGAMRPSADDLSGIAESAFDVGGGAPVTRLDGGVRGEVTELGGNVEFRGGACAVSHVSHRSSTWLVAFLGIALVLMRRRRARGAGPVLASASVALLAPNVAAQGFSIDRNAVPHAPEDLLWTERPAIPMDHLSFFGRAMLGYADDPLVVRDAATGVDTPVIDSQYSMYFSAGLALLDRFHASAMVPLYVHDASDPALTGMDTSGVAAGNPVIDARVILLPVGEVVELGAGAGVAIPVGSSSQLAADDDASGSVRVSVGRSWGRDHRSFVALNTGVRARAERTLGDVTAGSELTFGAGVNWAFFDALAATAEITGSTTFADAFDENSTPIGVLFGLRYAPDAWSAAAAVGPGITGGYGSPDVRVLAGGGARFNRSDRTEETAAPEVTAQQAVDPCEEAWSAATPEQCPHRDADGDGLANGKDRCALVPEDLDGFQDEDGCPDFDDDDDQVADERDDCPTAPEDHDDFQDDDGCPEDDNDDDGIVDADDQCPLDAETINDVDDEDGCPDKVRVVAGRIQTLEPVYFEYGSAAIAQRSEPMLAEVARIIAARRALGVVSIEGHTDSVGSAPYNLTLSQARAASVRRFLIGSGVDAERVTSTGFGESRPVAAGDSPEARAQNRRVEFRFGYPSLEPTTMNAEQH